MPRSPLRGWCIAALAATAVTGCAERAVRLSVKYRVEPRTSLPPDIRVIEVAQPSYAGRERDDGVVRDPQHRWYRQVLRRIEWRFREAASDVHIVNREDRLNTQTVQRDALYNGADPDAVAARPACAAVSAVIVPRIVCSTTRDILLNEPSWQERVIASGTRIIPGVGGPAPAASGRVQHILRANVSADVHMTRAASNQTLSAYACDLEAADMTDAGRYFGFDARRSAAELASEQRLLTRLVDEHVDNFLSDFLPILRHVDTEVFKPSSRAFTAIERLNAGDRAGARDAALQAYAHDDDDHAACFVLGLLGEMKGDGSEAALWYTRAQRDHPIQMRSEYALAQARAQRMTAGATILAAGADAADGR